MKSVSWLHLSDWHQKGSDFDRKVVRDALIKDIENRKNIDPRLEKIDFIIFSGDLAFSGKTEEYETAKKEFIDPILEATGLNKDAFFIVPGNHDINKDDFQYLPSKLLDQPKNVKETTAILNDKKMEKHLLEPFNSFKDSCVDLCNSDCSALGWFHIIEREGAKIAIIGCNSALFAERNVENKMVVGEQQIYEVFKKVNEQKPAISIFCMHHPLELLVDFDRHMIESRIKNDNINIVLTGHTHKPDGLVQITEKGSVVYIPAGASYNRRNLESQFYQKSYNFVVCDLDSCKGEAFYRKWEETNSIWCNYHDSGEKKAFNFSFSSSSSQPSVVAEKVDVKFESSSRYSLDNPPFNVPFRPKKEQFIGREELLKKVRDELLQGKKTSIGQATSFYGMGGIGKTLLAVEYANAYKSSYPTGVIWIEADKSIEEQLATIAKDADWVHNDTKESDILSMAIKRLRSYSDCLIIFDNLEKDLSEIEKFLPNASANPHIIVTSRHHIKGFKRIDINLLTRDQARELILLESNKKHEDLDQTEKGALESILENLDGLPLALEVAGAYIKYMDYSFQYYSEILKSSPQIALDDSFADSFTSHNTDVFKTLSITTNEMSRECYFDELMTLLSYSSVGSFMRFELIVKALNADEVKLKATIQKVVSLKLIQKASTGDRYTLHRLAAKSWTLNNPIKKEFVEKVCDGIVEFFMPLRNDFVNLKIFEEEISHLEAWAKVSGELEIYYESVLLWLQTYSYNHLNSYDKSFLIIKKAIEIMESKYKDKIPAKMSACFYDDCGVILSLYGSKSDIPDFLDRALYYRDKALQIRKEAFGEPNEEIANSYSSVGIAYIELGDYEKALELSKKSLEMNIELFGREHQNTVAAYNNLGVVYSKKGNYEKALEYQKISLDLNKNILKEDRPSTATLYNNIGVTYRRIGNYEKALECQKNSLEIDRNILGEEHPDTAASYNNMGVTFIKKGDYKEAFEYNWKALEINRRIFGEEHPRTAASYDNVGEACFYLGKREEYIKYREKALEIRIKTLGENHPDTANSYNNVGSTYGEKGNYNKALECKEKALEVFVKVLGKESSDTRIVFNNLLFLLEKIVSISNVKRKYDQSRHFVKEMQKKYGELDKDAKLDKLMGEIDNHATKNGFRAPSSKQNKKKKNRK